MRSLKGIFLIVTLVISFCLREVTGMEVMVSLYNERSVSTVIFSPLSGGYTLIADGRQVVPQPVSQPVYLTVSGELVMLSIPGHMGIYRSVHLLAHEETSEFKIRPLHTDLDVREYHGSVTFSVEFMRLKMINRVNIEYYVAAVVEAESGNNALPEFYKAQAAICRTYAMKHLNRHMEEGFNLCDEVHCQVYKGRLGRNPVILEATLSTRGIVIVDPDSLLITGAFHANCGGQTVNSEEVWLSARSYLRSVIDPYCVKRNRRNWETKISIEEWKSYLVRSGFREAVMELPSGSLRFTQRNRLASYRLNGDSIPLAKIRNDWRWRSAFFSIEPNTLRTEIIIKGQGHGHGIGMCQEGAMQMAVEGKNWQEIIRFYFQGVSPIEYTKVKDFRF